MNLVHRWLCSSGRWRRTVEQHVVPWVLDGLELGPRVLEVGPGYGAATDVLRARLPHLACVEIDPSLARGLARRAAPGRLDVVCGDGTALPLPAATFDTALCFTMLHHVAPRERQDRLLKEVARVLRPGGVFLGVDSLESRWLRRIHWFDTLEPVDPSTFAERLEAAGFARAEVALNPYAFRFRAWKAAD
jgi:SAM-dependent methyltransferase